MAISKVTTASITDADITTAKLAYDAAPFRNIIINGDMSIAQRGTSTSGLGSDGATTYVLDRFKFQVNGSVSTARYTVSQDTDVPTGQGFVKSSKIDVTTADASLNAGYFSFYRQEIEGQNLQYLKKGTANAESITMSFWVKSNKTGTYICEIDDNDNSRNINKSYTINSADTWEKKTITFAGDTTGTLDNDNGSSFRIFWWLAAGTDFTSGTLATDWESTVNANRAVGQVNLADSTANEWYITGVQLEAGEVASDFEFLPIDVNLQRCERYYEKTYNLSVAPGTSSDPGNRRDAQSSDGASNAVAVRNYKVRKRATATLTFYTGTTSGSVSYERSGASGTSTVNAWSKNGENGYAAYFGVGASWSGVHIEYHLIADAEL